MGSSYQKIKGVTVEIGGDTTKLGKALEDVDKKSRNLQGELKEIERLLKLDPNNTELLVQKQKVLAETLKTTKERLDILKEAEKQVQEQFEKGDVSEEQVRALAREIQSATSKIDKCEKESEETASAINDLGDNADNAANDVEDLNDEARNSEDAFNKADIAFGTFVGNLASDALNAGISKLKDVSKQALEVGTSFTSIMSEVKAIFNADDDEYALLEGTARKYGAETSFSATESAEALKYMGMAGWSVQDSIDGLSAVLDLAIASGEDLGNTSDIVTDALTAYKLTAKDATRFTDVLAAASSNANTNVSLMGETFKYVAPVAGAMNYSIEDSAVAIGLMANAGIKGSKSGTQLRTILANLAKPTDTVKAAMEKLNISLTDNKGKMKSLNAITKDLRKGFSKLSEAEKSEVAASLAGKEAMSGLLAIVGAADEDYDKLKKAIYNSTGAASKMSKTMKDNLSGDIKTLNSAWEEFELKLFDSVEEPLRDIVQFTTNKVMPAITDAGNWVKQHLPEITSLVEGLGGAIVTYKGAQKIKDVIDFTKHIEPASLLTTALVGGAGLVVALVRYAQRCEDARHEINILTEDQKKLIEKSNEAAEAFQKQQDETAGNIGGVQAQFDYVHNLVDELDKLVGKNGEVDEANHNRVEFILNEYKEATGKEIEFTDGVIKDYDKLKDEIYNVINAKKAEQMLEYYKKDYITAVQEETKAYEASTLALEEKKAAEDAVTTARKEYERVQTSINALEGKYNREALESYKDDLAAALEVFNQKNEAYENSLKNYDNYHNTVLKYQLAEEMSLSGNVEGAIQLLTVKSDAYKQYADTAEGEMERNIDNLERELHDAALKSQMIHENFKNGVKDITKEMVDAADADYSAVKRRLADAKCQMQHLGEDIDKSLALGIQKGQPMAYKQAVEVGEQLSKGMSFGIEKHASEVAQSAQNSVQLAIRTAKATAEIRSPSRKMQRLGEYMSEGLQVGIEAKNKSVTDAAREQMEQILKTYQNTNDNAKMAYEGVQAAARQASNINIPAPIDTMPILNKILVAIEKGQVIALDGDAIVGGTADKMNIALGKQRIFNARGLK